MTIISLDSSTEVCSAALLHDGTIISQYIHSTGSNHAALLPTFVQQLQASAATHNLSIDTIALSEGPGSYTGLRIATSLAKGLCYAADIPLIAVPTLATIAFAAIQEEQRRMPEQALLCPMIDARRMEVYCTVYDTQLQVVRPLAPTIIDEHSFSDLLNEHIVYFCGNGASKCQKVLQHPNAKWLDALTPTAANTGLIATRFAQQTALVRTIAGKQIAYFEPNYLKEFEAAPAHVKGLGV